jgi:hypothetical protein
MVIPTAKESRGVLVGVARSLTLGIPADATTDVDTVLASAPQRPEFILPEPDELMGLGATILQKHNAAAHARCPRSGPSPPPATCTPPGDATDVSPAAGEVPAQHEAHHVSKSSSRSSMAAKVQGVKAWLRQKMHPLLSQDTVVAVDEGRLHPAAGEHMQCAECEEDAGQESPVESRLSDSEVQRASVAGASEAQSPMSALIGLVGEGYQVRRSS